LVVAASGLKNEQPIGESQVTQSFAVGQGGKHSDEVIDSLFSEDALIHRFGAASPELNANSGVIEFAVLLELGKCAEKGLGIGLDGIKHTHVDETKGAAGRSGRYS